jgi:chromosome segregation protein
LQIKELRLSGFKSFVDPVRVTIDAGLTGIVGPNGCGKSNLLEAVRWAMGAASAKAMRAGDMDDVIFAGTDGRPAREHAEVTLVLDAANVKPPTGIAPADTFEISRRIKREAGSTYRVNMKEVRAKDVHLLFADGSTGANSPALVRQGQISELIAAKPENRRRVLEEAAGIAGLHVRRHEADLKLKQAEANLARLDEVVAEIEAQIAGLKRQAKQAERYRGLADDIRRHEALVFLRRVEGAQESLAEAQTALRAAERAAGEHAEAASRAARQALEAGTALAPVREAALIAAAVLRKLEGDRIGLQRDLDDAEAALKRAHSAVAQGRETVARETQLAQEANAALARLADEAKSFGADDDEAAIDAADRKAAHDARARAAAEADWEAVSAAEATRLAEHARVSERAKAYEQALSRAAERLESVKIALNAAPNISALESRVADVASTARDSEVMVVAARAQVDSCEAAARSAEDSARELEQAWRTLEHQRLTSVAEADALARLLATTKSAFAPVVQQIDVSPGFERALAAALGDDLEASLDPKAPLHWAGATPGAIAWPAGVSPLLDEVRAPEALQARFKACGIIDAKDAERIVAHLAPGARVVSREGDLWRWDGFVRRADAKSAAAARLEQHNRAEALVRAVKAQSAEAETARTAFARAQEMRQTQDAALRTARAALAPAEAKAREARAALVAIEAEAERARARLADLSAQVARCEQDRADCQAALKGAQKELADAPSGDPDALENARARAAVARAQGAESSAAAGVMRKARDARLARASAITQEQTAWARRRDETEARLAALAAQDQTAARALKDAQSAPEIAAAALAKAQEAILSADARKTHADDAVAGAERTHREAERTLREAEQAHARAREARAGAAARVAAAEERVTRLGEDVRAALGEGESDLAAKAGALMSQSIARQPIGEIEKRLDRLKSERDQAGPVNLRAEEELAEAQARADSLLTEKADVDGAILKLKQAIGRLNAEGRTRLMAAFTQVNANFATLFATLFEGGQAELRLTENDDPLLAGLEIYACPPGKRLASMSLMSGGEQALTATALIFAVFLANPAPLCVLDEVDAPLDDANVDRYCRLLDEMRKLTDTRFLIITHNPVTMARMDRLYGVTMAERGVSQIVSVDLRTAEGLAAA